MFRKTLIVLTLIILVALPAAAQESDTLTIAFIGASGGHDQQLYRAAALAVEEINALADDELTGPDGTLYTLELAYYSANTDDEAVDAYNDALDDDVIAALGPTTDSRIQAVLDNGQPEVPLFYADPAAPAGTNAYRLVVDFDTRAQTIADFLVNQHHITQIAVATADTETAQAARTAFISAAEDAGATIVADRTHPADADDLSQDADEIRDAGADALFLWTLDAPAQEMLRALAAEGWDGLIVYGELDEAFLQRADADLIVGLVGPVAWSSTAYDADSQNFVAAYQERWDAAPPADAAAYYDAIYLVSEALRKNGNATGLATLPAYDGVQGVYAGGKTDDLLMVQVLAGGLVEQARYTQGACANCPDYWLAEVSKSEATQDNLTLALIAALDGPTETAARQIEQAAELAVRQINDGGGVIGQDGVRYTFTLRTYEATTPAQTVEAVQKALEAGAVAILGPDSNTQIVNLPLTGLSGVPQLVSASSATLEREHISFLYQLRPADDILAESAAAYLLDVLGHEDIATVNARTQYAQIPQTAAENVIRDSDDGRVALALEYDLGEADFNDLARQIVSANVQSVMVWTPVDDMRGLLAALGAQGWRGTVLYAYVSPQFLDGLTVPAGIDVTGAVSWWHTAQDWSGITFASDYQATYGTPPAAQAAAYYDAVYLVAAGVQANGAADLRAWLGDVAAFKGVQGVYRPAASTAPHMTTGAIIIHVMPDGAVTELARYDGMTCLIGCGD
jgi:branched-chain amino acid transport system substrate-binding protein